MSQGTLNCGGESQQMPAFGVHRILGVYPQRQPGLFMQRIRVLGGRISWPQWLAAAVAAGQFCRSSRLHVTTRQDIELHNVPEAEVVALQQQLAQAGLDTRGACGDTVRNITCCTGCRYDSNGGGVFGLAELVHEHLAKQTLDLPRKFKISFSGCSLACARPWLGDLGFVRRSDGQFTVIGAGSLGPRPAAGVLLYEALPAAGVLPLCIAALRLFEKHGDRQNRHRARLRHVREKLGDQPFRNELDAGFRQMQDSQTWPDVPIDPVNVNVKLLWRLQLPNGNISCEDAIALADAAEPAETQLRINLEHGLELYGSSVVRLPEHLAALENNPVIIACPGTSTCARAIADTWGLADKIRQALAAGSIQTTRISISGCPNNCACSAAAQIGLIGLIRKIDGKATECFQVSTGGSNGQNEKLAEAVDIIPAEQAPAAIKRLFSGAAPPTSGPADDTVPTT